MPGNPLFSSTDANTRRLLAFGLRNPFRLAIRPGTNDVWLGDVGQADWEEINRVTPPFTSVRNFGWPCYEGGLNSNGVPVSAIHTPISTLHLNLCESLYSAGGAAPPYWAYPQGQKIVPGENCQEQRGSSISGVAFAPAVGNFPDAYDGALLFADATRNCIWALRAGANGLPDPATKEAFVQGANFPTDLEFGPNGELFYASIGTGTIKRINYTGNPGNSPPSAVATASPQSGAVPLEVSFDGSESSDPTPGDVLSYAWDLDDDGQLDDSTSPTPTHTYTNTGVYTVTLRVTDTSGAFDEDTIAISASNTPPTPTIDTPAAGTTWAVGQSIGFTGSATDAEDGTLPAAALDWQLILHHCTSLGNCHQHGIEDFENTASGAFVAPDHDYPAHLELKLTARDSSNNTATASREIYPRTVDVTAASDPPGMTVSLGSVNGAAPITATIIEGSAKTLSAPSPQLVDNATHKFSSWSDGQPQTHGIAPTVSTTYTARFTSRTPGISTVTFNPGADAYVEEDHPASNFGSAPTLHTDDDDAESYLRFFVDGLQGKVQNAKLRLFSTVDTVDGPALFATSSAWSESTINWNNKPAPSGAAVSDAGPISTGEWTEWDVTPAVTGEGNVGFRLASAVSDGVEFHSRESATADRRPELVLTVVNDSFARPTGASPMRLSLVPAYEACTNPNGTHGTPLADPSCEPPAQSSPHVTVGTPDANGLAVKMSASVRFRVIPGILATPGDEADVRVELSLNDMRSTMTLLDYAGEVRMRAALRITDRRNGAAFTGGGTLQDLDLPIDAGCTVTLDPEIGSTCNVDTTLDAIMPGVVDEGARSIWELGHVEVLDGGLDGDVDTEPNAVFARQGVFVP